MKIQSQALLLGVASTIAWGGINVAPSYALKLIGNLSSNQSTSTTLSSTSGSNVKTVAFSLPTGTDYILQNAVLRLGNYDSTDVFKVQIRNDSGGGTTSTPGSTVLADFNLPGSQGTEIFDYTFTSNTALTFQQNSKYWLYVDISSGSGGSGSIDWRASSPGVTPTGVASNGGYRFSNNGGATFPTSNTLNSFQINADPVAIPWETDALSLAGTTILFGFGLWGKNKLAQRKAKNLKP